MPRFDGTGPMGFGPGTGRGLGPCGGGMAWRRGFGLKRFSGRGFGYYPFFYQNLTKEEQKKILEEELTALKEEMKEIENELNELKNKKED